MKEERRALASNNSATRGNSLGLSKELIDAASELSGKAEERFQAITGLVVRKMNNDGQVRRSFFLDFPFIEQSCAADGAVLRNAAEPEC